MTKNQKILNIILIISNVIATIIYFLGNIKIIVIFWYYNLYNNEYKKLEYFETKYNGENGSGLFNFFWDKTWWFMDRNIILFIIISIFMLLSILIMPKGKKIPRIIIIYYVICFFLMEFIAFIETSYLINEYSI